MRPLRIRLTPSLSGSEPDELVRARAELEAQRLRLDAFFAARDAGRDLTTDALSTTIEPQTLVAAARDVADFADEALAIVQDEYKPQLACREGCAFCCRKPGVLVTVIDFLRILEAIEDRFSDEERTALAERSRRYAAQVEHLDSEPSTDASVPCPLLVDESCAVYDVRPLVCRGYNSTSADACRRAHEDQRELVPIFAVLKDTTDGAAVGVSQALQAAAVNGAMLDLGGALHAAVESGLSPGDVMAAGGADLAAVETPTWAESLLAAVVQAARQSGIPCHSNDDDEA